MLITLKVTKRRLLGVALAAAALTAAVWGGTALASSPSTNLTVCVRQNAKMFAPANGHCHGSATQYVLVTQTELDALTARVGTLETNVSNLQTLLSGVSRTTFHGYDTLLFDGMNVEVADGAGPNETNPDPGLGNLIVGYDEGGATGTIGSDNLVVGEGNEFSAFGGLVAGANNTVSGLFTSVSGGVGNTAAGSTTSVSGGQQNTASGHQASVSGGLLNTASGQQASISGGYMNTAEGDTSWVTGGEHNDASALFSSISGGAFNTTSGEGASISGGQSNTASGEFSSILGSFDVTLSTNNGTSPS